MQRTIKQFFCDRCGKEISQTEHSSNTVPVSLGVGIRLSVTLEYDDNNKEIKDGDLCDQCYIEILHEAYKKIKRKESLV